MFRSFHMYHTIELTLSRIFYVYKHDFPRTSCSHPSYNKCVVASKDVEYVKVLGEKNSAAKLDF